MIDVVDAPKRWPRVALGELCEIRGGYPAPTYLVPSEIGDVPFVRMKDVGRLHLTANLNATENSLTQEDFDSSRFALTPPGSILMPRSGSVALNHRALLRIPAVIVSHLCALVPNSPRVSSEYLYRYLCLADMRQLTKRTTGLDSIAFTDLRKVAVAVPPLAEQHRIANLLGEADVLRTNSRRALDYLEALARSIFLDMFGDPVMNPRGWPVRTIGSIGEVVTGNTPSRAQNAYYGDAIEWIKSDNINRPDYYLTPASEGLSLTGLSLARIAPPGSILVTCIAGSPDCIGNSAMADRAVAFNQQINAVIPKAMNPHFLYGQLRVGKALVQRMATSAMKGMVNKSRFASIQLISPPNDLQNEFAARIIALQAVRTACEQRLGLVEGLFSSLQYSELIANP